MLPNFMCIGAAKSGTTSLFEILKQHPDIYCPRFKEPHFFDLPDNYSKGIKWYERTYFSKADKKIAADLTPSYFYAANVPERILKDIGSEVKFVVLLRNPVDRAYSHYLHSVRDQVEQLSFKDALSVEKDRIKSYKTTQDFLLELSHSYISQGLYGELLQRYLQYFPLENFFFIDFENDFLNRRRETIIKLLHFLGVTTQVKLDIDIKSNPASKERSVLLKRMMKQGWWIKVLKKMIPFTQVRQIIRNRVVRLNLKEINPPKLKQELKDQLYQKYFAEDNKLFKQLADQKK
jgi:hypothetical protein